MEQPQLKTPDPNSGARRRALGVLLLILVVGGGAAAAWWLLHGRWHEATEDAYVSGHVVQVTPQIGGTVLAVNAEDTDLVKAGTPLIELDHADARVALDQAEASLAQTVREVRTLYANNSTLDAQVRARQTEVDRWRQDLARREAIANTGAVPLEEIDHARDALRAAEAALATAREQLTANRVMTDGAIMAQYPSVQRAAAKVEEAWLAWARSNVLAPVSGQVARRNVQVGQRVAPGTPLMAVVPLERLWVDANFKEGQLRQMKIGQEAVLKADLYGSQVEYHGHIVGMGAGTGAAFALLPAQNATGNWIKVVQRVPVRIALDAKELAQHPLRIGLSMQVDVETRDKSGQEPAQAVREVEPRFAAADATLEQARGRVHEIIQSNLGGVGKKG